MPGRGLKQLGLGQVPVFGIPNQVQDELDHLALRKIAAARWNWQ